MAKGDFASWAQQTLARQAQAKRAAYERAGGAPAPAQPPQLVTAAGHPIHQGQPRIMPPGTIPWGAAPAGAPQPTHGYAVPQQPYGAPMRSSVLMNREDGRDLWAERLSTLQELAPSEGDAMSGYYSPESLAALRAAGGGSSGARHIAHTIANGKVVGSQAIGDAPVSLGGILGPAEYGQSPMQRGAVIPLRPQSPPPMPAPQAVSVAAVAPAPAPGGDPFLSSLGMAPPDAAAAAEPTGPDPAAPPSAGQLPLL